MNWIEIIGSLATVLAVAGTVLNNHRRRECFYIWLASNVLTLGIHVAAGLWSLAARDVIFFALAIEGLLRWRREDRRLKELVRTHQPPWYSRDDARYSMPDRMGKP